MRRLILLLLLVPLGCKKQEEAPVVHQPPARDFELKHGMTIKDKSWTSENGTTKVEFTFDWEGALWVVNIEEGPFDESAHRFSENEGRGLVDGREWFGALEYPPQTEIKAFTVSAGGKEIDVPRELHSDLYNLSLADRETADFGTVYGIVVRGLPDGTMLLSSYGSDADAAYLVHWWIGGPKPPERQVLTRPRDLFEYADYFHTMVPERPSEVSTKG
jgi:hypothetical protein